jgi:Regulator of polyketide synthase expression
MKRLCNDVEKTYMMKLVAGGGGLDNYVRWVHIIEDREVPSFLNGNELVFTTGIAQIGENWLLEFVTNLKSKNASGAVVNIGPYIDEIPLQVIVYCEQNNLPLYTVPWSVHLIDITYDFCHRIIASEEVEIGLGTAMKNAIFSPNDEETYRSVLERRGFHYDGSYHAILTDFKLSNTDDDEKLRNMIKFQIYRMMKKLSLIFSLFFQERKMVMITYHSDLKKTEIITKQMIEICTELAPKMQLNIGVGTFEGGYLGIADSYQKAILALKVASFHHITCMYYEGIGVYKLLASVKSPEVLKEFYNEVLLPLETFDLENGTDYMQTLHSYLEHNTSVKEVAEIAGVHRNTVNYKIRKIKELLKCEINNESSLKLMLAFYIKNLL